MTDQLQVTKENTLSLTNSELSTLRSMIDAGDRAGFYLAYYAMTGDTEAFLQAKISSFSCSVGGAAFAADRLHEALSSPNSLHSAANILETISRVPAPAVWVSALAAHTR